MSRVVRQAVGFVGLLGCVASVSGVAASGLDFNQMTLVESSSRAMARSLVDDLTVNAEPSGEYYYDGRGRKVPLMRSTKWATVQLRESRARGGLGDPLDDLARNYSWIKQDRSRGLFDDSPDLVGAPGLRLVELRADAPRNLSRAISGDPGVVAMNPVYVEGETPVLVSGQFVVQFRRAFDRDSAARLAGAHGAQVVEGILPAEGVWILRVRPGSGPSTAQVAASLYESGEASFSYPDFLRPVALRASVNDPMFKNQWHLRNTGQQEARPGADAKVADAWALSKGAGITIAIIDSGVDLRHEDLRGKLLPGYDFIDGDSDPTPPAKAGHGTSCAGVAAAVTGNGKGVAGAAPAAKILPIRLIGGFTAVSTKAKALVWAVQHGADILSNSWGPADGHPLKPEDPLHSRRWPLEPLIDKAFDYALAKGRGGKGCVIVWAAGNGNESVSNDEMASSSKALTVAASTDHDTRAYYSDWGREIDVAAPSNGLGKRYLSDGQIYKLDYDESTTTGIWTTDISGSGGYNGGKPIQGDAAGNYTSSFGGTSSATPLVAGISALVLAANPDLKWNEVYDILRTTADKIDSSGGKWGKYKPGHSPYYGYGRVNARKAVEEAIRRKRGGSGGSGGGGGAPGMTPNALVHAVAKRIGSGKASNRNFGLIMAIDKSGENPAYQVGDLFAYGAKADRKCYLTVLSLDQGGAVSQLLPNRYQDRVVLEASKPFIVSKIGSVRIRVAPPAGQGMLVAISSKSANPLQEWKGKSARQILNGPWDVAVRAYRIEGSAAGGRDLDLPGDAGLGGYFEKSPKDSLLQQLEGGERP